MSGKQIFGAIFVIAYAITAFNTDSFGRGCLMIFVGFPALIVTGLYLLVKFIRGSLGYGERTEAKPEQRVKRKALAAVKKQTDPQSAALLQYIHDALREGGEEGAVKSALLGKGWPEEMIEGAFRAYKEILAKYPLPVKGLNA